MQRATVAMPALMGGSLPTATPILPIEIIGQSAFKNYKPTSVLLLLNLVDINDLSDDEKYNGSVNN
jgi:hypothetical protein